MENLDLINNNIEEIIKNYKRIAVVGMSDKFYRDSYAVASFMKINGYIVIPVNPKLSEVLGENCYPSLKEIPKSADLVNIFRRSDFVEEIVEEAIEIGAKAVWMQLGVINEKAAKKALDKGLKVVMNRCWKIEYLRYK